MKTIMLSGGLDSTILLADMIARGEDVTAVFIDYGQINAAQEAAAAERVAKHFGVPLMKLVHKTLFKGTGSSLIGEGKKHTVADDEIVNRNAVLISLAAAHCKFPTTLLVGAHKTEADYPDCTQKFYNMIDKLTRYSTHGLVGVEAPYIRRTKQALVQYAWYKLAFTMEEFNMTVSCYEGNMCGTCPACKAREKAFSFLPK